MATTTPFTYNDGTYIPGTEQVGDLAVGLVLQDYSGNPGGEKWWMGPDEDNRYVIGKDVPTEDWPTQIPEGDIGSVRFWATSTESDSEFIVLTNRVGSQSFTTISECLNWINTNGYWTNYPQTQTSAQRTNKTSFRIQPLPTFTRIATAGGPMVYNSTLEEMYVGLSYWEDSYTTYTPAYLDVSEVDSNLTIDISCSDPNQGYFVTASGDPSGLIPGSGNVWFDEDDYLYTIGITEKNSNGDKIRIAKYDVDTKILESYSSEILTPENVEWATITGLDNLGLIYIAYSSGSTTFPSPDLYIESYYTSSLARKDQYKIVGNFTDGRPTHYGITSNPTNNTIFLTGGPESTNTLLFNGADLSLIATEEYSNIPRTGNILYDGPLYVSSVNRFYFRTGRSNEPSGPLKKSDGLLIAVNSDNTLNTKINLGGGDGSNVQMNIGGIAYDPKRKVIWTATRDLNSSSNLSPWLFQAIDPSSNKLVKTCPQPFPLISSGGEGLGVPHNFAIDTTNDKLYVSSYVNNPKSEGNLMVWDLDDLWNTTV